jgi:hypothetical protein
MTITAERQRYVGARRFDARPLSDTRPRHRTTEALAVALAVQLAEVVLGAGRALVRLFGGSWGARTVTRAAVVVIVSAFLLAAMLFGSVLVMVEPLRGQPYPMTITPSPAPLPSPTPYPGGWTYTP